MTLALAIFYGIVQGLTEFLPISSSGHLAILPFLFSFKDPGVAFDLMMHIGTALAVICYYYKDILLILSDLPKLAVTRDLKLYPKLSFLMIGTLASVVLIVILKPIAEFARDPLFIAFNMIFFGFLLWRVSIRAGEKNFKELNIIHAILIGLAQSIAIFPGVSRSGITLSTAYALGYNKEEAGSYSFLLSLPIILAGAITKLPDLEMSGEVTATTLMAGVLSSFIVGILTIHFFMKFIRKVNFFHFFVYRFILGLVLIAFIYQSKLF